MALFSIICLDRPNALEARMGARADHLAFVDTFGSQVKIAGPFLSDDGQMIGSLLVMEFETKAEADAFVAGDPYGKAGVFESVTVYPFRVTRGGLA